MSIYVREFDHSSGQWSTPIKAFGLNNSDKNDYHNYPCIALAPDGHYLIFYFRHSSTSYMLKSPSPDKITGVWSRRRLSNDKCAYPMPVVMGDDAVYLIYSSTAAHRHRPYRMIKPTDNGETWSKPVTLIDSGHKQEEKYAELYAHGFSVDKGGKERPARIPLGWEMALGPRGHNKGGYGNFFAYFNCQDQEMYTAGNQGLGSTTIPRVPIRVSSNTLLSSRSFATAASVCFTPSRASPMSQTGRTTLGRQLKSTLAEVLTIICVRQVAHMLCCPDAIRVLPFGNPGTV
jgi:hypothetical protein